MTHERQTEVGGGPDGASLARPKLAIKPAERDNQLEKVGTSANEFKPIAEHHGAKAEMASRGSEGPPG